jgi:predicted RNase H-like HicB family nuclease
MDNRAKAESLANRPYFIMTSADTTTEGHPIYFARIPEMEGCFGQGETREAAIEDLRLAMVDFIESLLEDGLPVAEPTQLINPTLGTGTEGAFTFTKVGKELRPKHDEAYPDAFLLSVHAE